MSKRKDDDSRLATGMIHIIEALRTQDAGAAIEHLALAEKQALIVLNRGLDQWHPDYQTATTVTPPAPVEPKGD